MEKMKNTKKGIMFLLAILVLILCGILPIIIAKIQDDIVDEKVVYEDVKTVQLLHELNDMEKLYLLKSGSYVEIAEERAKLKMENIREVVETALRGYVKQGLIIGNLSNFSIECEPLLYYSNQMSNVSGIFWKVTMELWDDLGQSIFMYLDDATGKVVSISYNCLEQIYPLGKLSYYNQKLFALYQSQMGDEWEVFEAEKEVNSEEYKSREVLNFRMGDMIYGEITIQFIITETGFKIDVQ